MCYSICIVTRAASGLAVPKSKCLSSCIGKICVQTGCKVDRFTGLIVHFNIKAGGNRVSFNYMMCFLLVYPSFSLPFSFLCYTSVKNLLFFKWMKGLLGKEPFTLLMMPFTWLEQGEPRRAIFWIPPRNVRLEWKSTTCKQAGIWGPLFIKPVAVLLKIGPFPSDLDDLLFNNFVLSQTQIAINLGLPLKSGLWIFTPACMIVAMFFLGTGNKIWYLKCVF